MCSGAFPSCWKTSFVSLVFKSGDRNSVINYRPICIISCIPKLFESIVCKDITAMMRREIIGEQFELISESSTELNLLLYSGFLSRALEEGTQIHSLYTDFSKAFDKVNQRVLVSILEKYGISGPRLA